MKMEQTVFLNVGIRNSDAGELPRRKHTTLRIWRKFEIKDIYNVHTTQKPEKPLFPFGNYNPLKGKYTTYTPKGFDIV
jgi:hypothetical protein